MAWGIRGAILDCPAAADLSARLVGSAVPSITNRPRDRDFNQGGRSMCDGGLLSDWSTSVLFEKRLGQAVE